MRLRKHKSSLDDWLGRGESPEKFSKLVFYFFSRFILVFCVLHYFGVAYPESGWVFPGPTSNEFWACCVLFTVIFAAVFYVLRGKRNVSGNGSKKDPIETARAMTVEEKREVHHVGVIRAASAPVVEEKREGRHGGSSLAVAAPVVEEKPEGPRGGVRRAAFASLVEEKREGRHGGVGRATFAPEPELEEERSENQGNRRQ